MEIFCESFPIRHKKYKIIDFVPSNKSSIANKLFSTNFERFLRRIKSPLTRLTLTLTYRALIVTNWPKWQSLNPLHR